MTGSFESGDVVLCVCDNFLSNTFGLDVTPEEWGFQKPVAGRVYIVARSRPGLVELAELPGPGWCDRAFVKISDPAPPARETATESA